MMYDTSGDCLNRRTLKESGMEVVMNHESNRDNYRTNYGILSSVLQLMELVSLIGLLFCGLLHGGAACTQNAFTNSR